MSQVTKWLHKITFMQFLLLIQKDECLENWSTLVKCYQILTQAEGEKLGFQMKHARSIGDTPESTQGHVLPQISGGLWSMSRGSKKGGCAAAAPGPPMARGQVSGSSSSLVSAGRACCSSPHTQRPPEHQQQSTTKQQHLILSPPLPQALSIHTSS